MTSTQLEVNVVRPAASLTEFRRGRNSRLLGGWEFRLCRGSASEGRRPERRVALVVGSFASGETRLVSEANGVDGCDALAVGSFAQAKLG